MSGRRLFSHNPVFGLTKYWHYDDDTDTAVIETVQDTEPLLDALNEKRKEQSLGISRMRDGVQHVACVPMHIYGEWLRTGLDKDQAFLKRWLNDPANAQYRSYRARV